MHIVEGFQTRVTIEASTFGADMAELLADAGDLFADVCTAYALFQVLVCHL
jgi:hypothetical protein